MYPCRPCWIQRWTHASLESPRDPFLSLPPKHHLVLLPLHRITAMSDHTCPHCSCRHQWRTKRLARQSLPVMKFVLPSPRCTPSHQRNGTDRSPFDEVGTKKIHDVNDRKNGFHANVSFLNMSLHMRGTSRRMLLSLWRNGCLNVSASQNNNENEYPV